MLPEARVERYYNTVWAIAASPYVFDFVIGMTGRGAEVRAREYRRHKYEYLVTLADRLTQAEALWLEGQLFQRMQKDRRHTLFRKYWEKARTSHYRPSYGNSKVDPNSKVHSVYMAWWEPDAVE